MDLSPPLHRVCLTILNTGLTGLFLTKTQYHHLYNKTESFPQSTFECHLTAAVSHQKWFTLRFSNNMTAWAETKISNSTSTKGWFAKHFRRKKQAVHLLNLWLYVITMARLKVCSQHLADEPGTDYKLICCVSSSWLSVININIKM